MISLRRALFIFVLAVAVLQLLSDEVVANEQAEDGQSFFDQQLEQLQLEEIQQYWDQIAHEYGGFLPESQKGTFMEFVRGEKEFQFKEWLTGFIKYLVHELLVNGKLLGMLILLTLFSIVLQTLQNAFEQHTISKVANIITYMVLIVIALNCFHVVIGYATDAIETMIHFMIALFPMLLALMSSIGSFTTVALFHPFIVFLVNTSGLLISHLVLPLLFLSAVLSIVSTLTEQYKVTKLANFLRNFSIGTLAVFLTIFLGVISVQGASTAVADGITIRTAKFIAGNFIPVVGKMFTEATDTVMGASLLLKNTIGLAGLAILLLLCAFPAIKVLSMALIFHIAAAILQPLGGGPIIECLSIIGKTVIFIFAALVTVSLMFFLAITIVVASGNIALMMR